MSEIFKKINLSLNEAIKSKNSDRVLTLRSIVSQKKDKEIELRTGDQKEILDTDITNILNKMPDASLSQFGIKSGDRVFVLNFQPNNAYVTHLNNLHERHKSGALKVR